MLADCTPGITIPPYKFLYSLSSDCQFFCGVTLVHTAKAALQECIHLRDGHHLTITGCYLFCSTLGTSLYFCQQCPGCTKQSGHVQPPDCCQASLPFGHPTPLLRLPNTDQNHLLPEWERARHPLSTSLTLPRHP